jgi:hypothetical protein
MAKRLFRYRLRTLLIAVPVAAIALWQWQRINHLLNRAAEHEAQGLHLAIGVGNALRDTPLTERDPRKDEAVAASNQAFIHRELAKKYRRAVWRPWISSIKEPPPGMTSWEYVQWQ